MNQDNSIPLTNKSGDCLLPVNQAVYAPLNRAYPIFPGRSNLPKKGETFPLDTEENRLEKGGGWHFQRVPSLLCVIEATSSKTFPSRGDRIDTAGSREEFLANRANEYPFSVEGGGRLRYSSSRRIES